MTAVDVELMRPSVYAIVLLPREKGVVGCGSLSNPLRCKPQPSRRSPAALSFVPPVLAARTGSLRARRFAQAVPGLPPRSSCRHRLEAGAAVVANRTAWRPIMALSFGAPAPAFNLSAEYVRSALHYDPETGAFTWMLRPLEHFPNKRTWRAWNARFAGRPTGTDNGQGYISIRLNSLTFKGHRIAWLWMTGAHPVGEIDHINQQPGDNRFENLRDVCRAANQQNQRHAQRSNVSTGLLGAYADKATGRFRAAIRANGQQHYLGQFDTAEAAHAAYIAAKRSLQEGCTI